jgi:hypothetical protein
VMGDGFMTCCVCGEKFEATRTVAEIVTHSNKEGHWFESDIWSFFPQREEATHD